ncbi:MAG: ADP-ribosylglycohydrolase family protein [Sutterellaceae bacterium]|nr:ADP-ribosylglycohydrolase family protein [Burkholderiaceae bacterium]MDW8430208.1 ADP-ribosylglycohydrolase family protein [Sutterellaceae bacterium]
MFGALVGDLIGSVHEFAGTKRKDFSPLIHPAARFTDDSVLTCAVAEALLAGERAEAIARRFKRWGNRYPRCGFSAQFREWLWSSSLLPFGSFGNGAAMRVSPAALLARTADEALALAQATAEVTHDHPEGIRGAQAAALATFLALRGEPAQVIRRTVAEQSGYDLSRSVDEIRPAYRFDGTCQGSVPQALVCALEALDFEDAIRNAISLGGDADTLAAIAGAVAEARFGIPQQVARQVEAMMPADMREVMSDLYARAGRALPWAQGNMGTATFDPR